MTHGTKAEWYIIPTVLISIGRTAAARGVPKSAENAALMPHMMTCLLSSSGKCSSLAMAELMLPPICRAAPSRPAEPPVRWVSDVAAKISGARAAGTSSPFRIEARMRFVPPTPAEPAR